MSMRVPFYSAAASIRADWPQIAEQVRQIGATGVFTNGPTVEALEAAIVAYTGVRHTVAVSSGTDALIVLLEAAGIGPGDEVVVPAYTFVATASAVVHVGARPVFVDVLPASYAMDADAALAAITPRTAAIMPVHLFSQMADMRPIVELADRHGLLLVEDSAESIGMWAGGRHAGCWGRGGVLSFFPSKTLGALGDAGMVLSDDVGLAARVRALARGNDGASADGWFASGCDELQAAVLLARLRHLDADIARRAVLAARYDRRLANLAPRVVTPRLADAVEPSNQVFYVYLVECERRDELASHLAGAGIETEIYYPRPLTRQPCFTPADATSHPVPEAERASARALALPLYADLSDDQVDAVCDAIAGFYQGR